MIEINNIEKFYGNCENIAELPSFVPNALAVKASKPNSLTILKAASMISSLVNFALGGIFFTPYTKIIVLKHMF